MQLNIVNMLLVLWDVRVADGIVPFQHYLKEKESSGCDWNLNSIRQSHM